jgi:hypothetical protein
VTDAQGVIALTLKLGDHEFRGVAPTEPECVLS